jgi:DNA-directed RNA polymerase subunit M/transcription elongation factor TFIIS
MATSVPVRAASDAATKYFMTTRAKTVRVVLSHCNDDPAAARDLEAEIYRRAHTSVEVYLDVAVGLLRRIMKNKPKWEHRVPYAHVPDTSRGGSASELRNFFHINWNDILNEEARFSLAQCARCRSREIYAVTAQLRSADEGMSVICTCQRCGEQWTQR